MPGERFVNRLQSGARFSSLKSRSSLCLHKSRDYALDKPKPPPPYLEDALAAAPQKGPRRGREINMSRIRLNPSVFTMLKKLAELRIYGDRPGPEQRKVAALPADRDEALQIAMDLARNASQSLARCAALLDLVLAGRLRHP